MAPLPIPLPGTLGKGKRRRADAQEPPTTVSSVPIEALYTQADLGDFDPTSISAIPANIPTPRRACIHYRSRLWTCGNSPVRLGGADQ